MDRRLILVVVGRVDSMLDATSKVTALLHPRTTTTDIEASA